MECQEGVIGGEGKLGALAHAVAQHGTVGAIGRVLAAAREACVRSSTARCPAVPTAKARP
jgi:hypothetical protein